VGRTDGTKVGAVNGDFDGKELGWFVERLDGAEVGEVNGNLDGK